MNVQTAERSTRPAPAAASAAAGLAAAPAAAPFRRWLILTQYYHPEPGAPQIRLRAMVRELVRRGCEVEVLTALPNYPVGRIFPEYRGRLFATDVVDGVPVHRHWIYPAAGRRPLARLMCYLTFTLGAMLRTPMRKPDVVFVEAQPLTLALAGYLTRILRGVPYIYNTPDLQVEIAGDKRWLPAHFLVAAAAKLENFLMRRALCVSTVTDAFVEHFATNRGIGREHVTFLPNGADTESLRPLPPDLDYARELGVEGKTVFTYAGTHAPYQGLEIILEAAARLRDRSDIAILMVGNGPLRAALREKAAAMGLTNVLFRESPFSEMARLMSLTRASIATISEMQAAAKMRLSKVVPPLACGVPVVYVGAGESAAMLREHDCGRVVESRSADDFAATLRELAGAPQWCLEMGRRGRDLVLSELSWSVIVERWLAELQSIKSRRNGRGAGV
jgi:glycosyltransferase involved in cell wall biosynthesis